MKRRHAIPLLVLLLLPMLQVACGSAPKPPPLRRVHRILPPHINDSTLPAHVRRFHELAIDDKERWDLRKGLIAHLRTKTQERLDADNYDAVVEHFVEFTSLYTPAEIADGNLPDALEPICEYLIDHGSPRGDEARVLSSLLVLHNLHPDDSAHFEYYQRLRRWSIETRTGLGSPFGLDDELIDVWSEHARMTPTPDLLSQLARYHIDFRNALLQQFQSPERIMPMGREYYELVQAKAFDVAGVFLRYGDTASALSHLRAIGPAGNRDAQLLTLLERAQEDDDEGADALWALAHEAPYARGDKDVSESLCKLGHMEHPRDPRFPRCLATLAMLKDDLDGVLSYYMEALALSADREPVYDEL
ncbi:MAG: hypothetical protein OXR73_15810, partial [Myxococcales bacterium]|nr:hypothetical protein [Myxococcales bacterium]